MIQPNVLCVIGDLVEDVVVHVDATPARGTDTPAWIERTRGGSAANVAVAAAAGCATRFIGRVGDDAAGSRLAHDLAASGVDVRVQRSGRTGCIVVVVEPGGERTMLPDRAAAAQLGPIDPAWLIGAGWVHVPAYSLCAEPIGASTTAAIELARAAGAGSVGLSVGVSSVGAVAAFGAARFVQTLIRLDPDVVLANEEEAALLGTWRPALLVVTRGARPVLLHHMVGGTETVDVPPVEGVVDTTGAGDAFAGGFLAGLVAGCAPTDAARAGIALAARTLHTPGAGLAP